MLKAFGLEKGFWSRRLLGLILWPPARRFASLAAAFDHQVAEVGFCEAARWALPRFIRRVEVLGREHIPLRGPLLVASNHPGVVDALAIAAELAREDLKIIATAIPFMRGLPSSARHLIYTPRPNDLHGRMSAVRAAIRHLRGGGALLIFPGGTVDPDPEVLPGADLALKAWSPSIGLILKAVPQARVLLTVISGLLSPGALENPIARLRREVKDRQIAAEILQVMRQLITSHGLALTARLSIGQCFMVGEPPGDPHRITQSIIARAQNLLSDHLAWVNRLKGDPAEG